jgi:8-oxo-dGTP diphosphatase
MSLSFDDIDWETWTAQQVATLLFVIRDGNILLIHKKRGIGAGKINGPGGRVGLGEQPIEAAVREVVEELRVTPVGVERIGEVLFQVRGDISIHIHVFRASDCVGAPQETDEAVPLWTPLDQIPFDQMWDDDRLWFPYLLEGQPFQMRTLFDGEVMIGHQLVPLPGTGSIPAPRG